MYDEAMEGIKTHLLKQSVTKGLLYTAELNPLRNQKSVYAPCLCFD